MRRLSFFTYCFTSPTKEDLISKLVSASLRIHGSRGGFLLLSVAAHNQPFVRVLYIDSLLWPRQFPARSPEQAWQFGQLVLPARLAIIITNTKVGAYQINLITISSTFAQKISYKRTKHMYVFWKCRHWFTKVRIIFL